MSLLPDGFEVCDCHSHVYGPFDRFPLSSERMFDPPSAAIDALEKVWNWCGIHRAVLVQGSAYGSDHRALLGGIALDPQRRRGVAVLDDAVSDEEIKDLHLGGVRAIRFNWVGHLLRQNSQSSSLLLKAAASLARRVFALGWHLEIHTDPDSLDLVEQLELQAGQVVVVDHMARVDGTLGIDQPAFRRLMNVLAREHVWVKLSGADRVARRASTLSVATNFIARLAEQAPDRCVWGHDWPHVNLSRVYGEHELLATLQKAIPDMNLLVQILCVNPARRYGFPINPLAAGAKYAIQGAMIA